LAPFFAALLQLVNFSISEVAGGKKLEATRTAERGGVTYLQRLLPQHSLFVAVLHHLRLKPAAQQ
jgi:hypothetical protein